MGAFWKRKMLSAALPVTRNDMSTAVEQGDTGAGPIVI